MFYKHFRRFIDFNDPKTFSEKIQWLKLYDRKPVYSVMVDKYEAKKYAAGIIGKQYIIPTLGVWDHVSEIEWDRLPNQFVLKCTHDSGSIVICKDKSTFDRKAAVTILKKGMTRNGFWYGREWPYKNVRPRIIAEQYMEDCDTRELRDYKFFTFDGTAKAVFIATERQNKYKETTFDFYDMNFEHLPFTNGHPNAAVPLKKPECFSEMISLAEKLSAGIPHLRVDFYVVNGRIYFGELTFSHWSGFKPFVPQEWDTIFGSWINLPVNNNGISIVH